MKRLLTILFSITLCLVMVRVASANLVVNGDFQDFYYSQDQVIVIPSWNGWIQNPTTQGSNYYIASIPGPSMYQAVFAGPGPGLDSIGQGIQTVPGLSYTFSFWLAQPYDLQGQYAPGEFYAFWNGTPILSITDAIKLNWTHYTYTVVATGSSSGISFSGHANTRWDDARGYFFTSINVSPTAVPIPGTLLLLGPCVFGLMAVRRRFKK